MSCNTVREVSDWPKFCNKTPETQPSAIIKNYLKHREQEVLELIWWVVWHPQNPGVNIIKLHDAQKYWGKATQSLLRAGQCLNSDSRIWALKPYLEEELPSVRAKLQLCDFTYREKHPQIDTVTQRCWQRMNGGASRTEKTARVNSGRHWSVPSWQKLKQTQGLSLKWAIVSETCSFLCGTRSHWWREYMLNLNRCETPQHPQLNVECVVLI